MSNQLCIPNGERCVDCSEYAEAFSCLPKIKVSYMTELSKLDTIALLDKKCADIIFPITTLDCEKYPESFAMSLKDLLDIINTTSVGEKEKFPDIKFTRQGQVTEYKISLFNPHSSRDMLVSYFFTASAKIYSSFYPTTLEVVSDVDNEVISNETLSADVFGKRHENWVYVDGLTANSFHTKVIGPKETTEAKIILTSKVFNKVFDFGSAEEDRLKAENIQLMITGVTK